MARGRIIVSAITYDKRVNNLSDDTSRLAFTWLVTFADREGRTYGDPAVVRSMLFPRREDVSIAQMEQYIKEWATCGLIDWYEADGDQWISFPSFLKHQGGFDKRHEPASTVPVPPPARAPGIASTMPVQCTAEVKRREVNHGVRELENTATPNADALSAIISGNGDDMTKKSKKPHKQPERSQQECELMGVFCDATGLHLPQKIQDVNWWFSELRAVVAFVDGDTERAKKLIRDTVLNMQRKDLDITTPKSIVGMANALAAHGVNTGVYDL